MSRLRDVVFIHGSSVGFYPTLLFSFLTIAPYCLLLGFVLPYSLFVLRTDRADYPGARIYITDNIGDVCGGALFALVPVPSAQGTAAAKTARRIRDQDAFVEAWTQLRAQRLEAAGFDPVWR